MKYPWVAFTLMVVWFSTTYIVLVRETLDVPNVLITSIVGTIVIAIIGFRPPKIKNG